MYTKLRLVNSFLFTGLFLVFACVQLRAQDFAFRELRVNFYDQNLSLSFDPEMVSPHVLRVEELALRHAFDELNRLPYQVLLTNLQAIKEELKLNDWLYSQLLQQALSSLYEQTAWSPKVQLATYFLLAKSGFDVRLTYRDKRLQVNVYTNDQIYDIPLITDEGRSYANVSVVEEAINMNQAMYLLNHRPEPEGKAFSFLLEYWPVLMADNDKRVMVFNYEGETFELGVIYNKGIAKLLKNYPLVDEQWYLDAPMSNALAKTLVPPLRDMMADKQPKEALELLAAFTRSSFDYKEDKEFFGSNKPMVADELFYYPFSDCEDRSALFYTLAKVLLDLPIIVIAYDDHLSLAVAAPGMEGDAVEYNGKKYFFCDPTGPENSSEIGKIPQGYKGKPFEVIGAYP